MLTKLVLYILAHTPMSSALKENNFKLFAGALIVNGEIKFLVIKNYQNWSTLLYFTGV